MSRILPYPYPVLGEDEQTNDQFSVNMDYVMDSKQISLLVSFSLNNSIVAGLIQNNMAEYVVEVRCNGTYYRDCYVTHDDSIEIVIDSARLRGKVDVVFSINATCRIDNFSLSGFMGDGVSLNKGDVIGLGGIASFVAEKEFNPLKAPIKSIIKIMKSDLYKDELEMIYDDDDYIKIVMPEYMYEKYTDIRNVASASLHASIVFPALMDIIDTVKNGDFGDKAWALKLREICEARKVDLDEDDAFIIAQRILDNPVNRMLDWCNKTMDEGE